MKKSDQMTIVGYAIFTALVVYLATVHYFFDYQFRIFCTFFLLFISTLFILRRVKNLCLVELNCEFKESERKLNNFEVEEEYKKRIMTIQIAQECRNMFRSFFHFIFIMPHTIT